MRFTGKVAVVTGGAQGIGRAIAERLTADGATVVIGDVRAPSELQLGQESLPLDVTDDESVEAFIGKVAHAHGGIDIVVNNAGIMFEEHIDDHSIDLWNKAMAVNVTGPFLVTRAAIPFMQGREGASVVNIGSIEGFAINPEHTAYAASKAAVHGMTSAMAIDLGPMGIRVNAVAPGWIDTDLNRAYVDSHPRRQEVVEDLSRLHPVGRIGSPSDVAAAVAWLASDDAGFVTGQQFTIDGGRTVRVPLPGAFGR